MTNEVFREILGVTRKIIDKEIANALRKKDYETAIIGSFFNGLVKEAGRHCI